jgi:hypothetical protein
MARRSFVATSALTARTALSITQAKQVVAGNRIIPDRLISIHDPMARPIKKGKLAKKVEFGYKVWIGNGKRICHWLRRVRWESL